MIGFSIEITSSTRGFQIFAVTAGIKKYKSIIKKNTKKHSKILFLAKSKLKSIKVFISNAGIDLAIIHEQFVLTNNVLKEYDKMKEEIKELKI